MPEKNGKRTRKKQDFSEGRRGGGGGREKKLGEEEVEEYPLWSSPPASLSFCGPRAKSDPLGRPGSDMTLRDQTAHDDSAPPHKSLALGPIDLQAFFFAHASFLAEVPASDLGGEGRERKGEEKEKGGFLC